MIRTNASIKGCHPAAVCCSAGAEYCSRRLGSPDDCIRVLFASRFRRASIHSEKAVGGIIRAAVADYRQTFRKVSWPHSANHGPRRRCACGLCLLVFGRPRRVVHLVARKDIVAIANYAHKRGLLLEAPDVPLIQKPLRLPEAYTLDQVQALVRAAGDVDRSFGGVPGRFLLSHFGI